jgi:solute carrier family 32 (vesicular inhibitory amino acid transporter)
VDEDEETSYGRTPVEGPSSGHSLLRAALQNESQHRRVSEDPFEDENGGRGGGVGPSTMDDAVSARLSERRVARNESLASYDRSLSPAFIGSFSTNYGSLGSNINEASMRHAGRLFHEQQAAGVTAPDKEREPLLVKQVEQDDGKVVNVVVGQSTLPQTVFNSSNVLIGVGLLSLPLALKYAGWVIGLIFFFYSALVTNYTAKLLAKCLDVDNALITFADLAYVAFGNKARIATSILFTLELLGACVALVVLFADSLDALIPGLDVTGWKIICGIVLLPLAFMPLRLLSFTSILGILCCAGITIGIFVDGFLKAEHPGSLRQPAHTYLFPENWGTVPLSFGLIMSPWGGHSVFPNIYRDMRHPQKYSKGVNITYMGSVG